MNRNDWMKELRKIVEEQLDLRHPDHMPALPEYARVDLSGRWQATRDRLVNYLF